MQDRLVTKRISGARKSVLLLGPRQVGKSTLCRALNPNLTIDLADERTYLSYAKDPSLLRSELAALKGKGLILVDEIQRHPRLLNTVQSVMDNPANSYRFLLTGSSARKLRRGGVNLQSCCWGRRQPTVAGSHTTVR
jgi:predicted AAA+ superfamily ATPase